MGAVATTVDARTLAARELRVRASKFKALLPRQGAVVRDRLLQRLTAATDTPIVLIAASAGYGKSTLAAQWGERCNRPVVWINLDRSDNDPVVLLHTLTRALDRVDPVDPELLAELSGSSPRIQDVVLPAFAAELDRLSPLELVLDDTHELTQPQSVDILSYLLAEVRPPFQALLLTHGDARLPIARLRVAGGLLEIRAEDLALDADEVHELATNSGARLSEQTLELLHERTEGWPAGIALALHTLDESASADEVAQTISGSHRDIADYLTEVILDRETEERRRFLLATSVLTQMTAPLCDAILGVKNSNKVLAELERTNSFVIALDDHRGWYRYHHLFAELLRSELDRTDPDLARVYLSRAAAWYQQEGTSPDQAFRCARESGDLKLAGTIVMAVMDDFVRQGRIETLKQWLDDCTDEEICSDPQLAIVAGWVHLHLGDAEAAERFTTAAADGDLDNGPSAEGLSSLRSSLADLRSFLAPNGVHKMLEDAEFVLAADAGSANPHGLIDGTLAAAIANLILGRPDTAVAALREALALTVDNPAASAVRIVGFAFLGFASAETGDWSAARRAAREAVAASAGLEFDQTLHAGISLTARAMVLVHDGDFDRASVELASAQRASQRYRAMRWLNTDQHLRWGNISLDLGDRPAAAEHADSARAALHGYADPGTLPWRLAELDKRVRSLADLHLTPAEIRILPFFPTHLSVKEIAERLHVSPATVKTHVSSVYTKLGAATRSDAVQKMEQAGLQPSGARLENGADLEPN